MKIVACLSAIAVALASSSAVQAQTTGVQVGAKAGVSLAVLDGQINEGGGYKPGLALGGFLRWRLSERIALQPELVYSQQGAKNNGFLGPYPAETKVKLNYLNVPVLLKIYLGSVVNVQVGPQFGLLLSGRRTGQVGYNSSSGYVEGDEDVKADYKGDVALSGGLGVDLKNGLLFSARLNYGLTNIDNNEARQALRKDLGLGDLHNRAFEFAVGYAFGSK